jgi:hypothetical protein
MQSGSELDGHEKQSNHGENRGSYIPENVLPSCYRFCYRENPYSPYIISYK